MEDSITWVGLDAHKDFINVAVHVASGEWHEWKVDNSYDKVRRLAQKLVSMAPAEVRACYEAGGGGYALKRQLESAAPMLVCEVIAPALIPKKPGVRVKTDRRDARMLAETFEAGLLTEVHVPSEEDEAVRDLCRCRDDLRRQLMAARHHLSKWLLRRSLHWARKNWTKEHREWLESLSFERNADRYTFETYLKNVEHLEQLKAQTETRVAELAQQAPYAAAVGRLRCFHGIDFITALSVVAELHDLRRFESARKLMAFLGLTPSEYSSGGRAQRGGITKTGNSHVRRLLVEVAWHHRHAHGVSAALVKRRAGQPQDAIAIADRAHQRLTSRYRKMSARGIAHPKAVVAVARELAGFIWATLQHWDRSLAAT
ncbi:MAG: IS110 family transposase [Polyangiales bacterium]